VRRRRSGRKRMLVVGTPLFQHVFDRLVYKRWSLETAPRVIGNNRGLSPISSAAVHRS
jgi:hypothetical protein